MQLLSQQQRDRTHLHVTHAQGLARSHCVPSAESLRMSEVSRHWRHGAHAQILSDCAEKRKVQQNPTLLVQHKRFEVLKNLQIDPIHRLSYADTYLVHFISKCHSLSCRTTVNNNGFLIVKNSKYVINIL